VAVNPNIIKTLLERNWIRVVGHRDVPGKPELLGTTREFLDYFSLKKLDDLPTLSQLKELEDLRVQLTLPGADPQVAAELEADANADPLAAASEEDEETDAAGSRDVDGVQDAEGASPHPQGLVASGAQDEPN
jgi:segregation and condensation protein B